MPLSGGTSGAHDDAMHQGSAKRDVAGGVGGLDASGFLLAKGAGILFPRTGSDDVHIYERTSGEEAYAFHRVGADDYTFYIKELNVWKRFQTESMKDVANGIAGISAGGSILAPGASLVLTRDGSEYINLFERTSMEIAQRWGRIGVNDYRVQLMIGGSYQYVQHAGMKDVANGIAGLDANGRIGEARVGGLLRKYIIGDADAHTFNPSEATDSSSYTNVKQMTLNVLYPDPSTIRIRFQLHCEGAAETVYGRIYKNGAAVGTERSTGLGTPQTYDEDISFADGDLLQIYAHTTSGTEYAVISDFIIRGTEHQQTLLEAIQQTDVGVVDPVSVTNT